MFASYQIGPICGIRSPVYFIDIKIFERFNRRILTRINSMCDPNVAKVFC
jgi:hypothetical protein